MQRAQYSKRVERPDGVAATSSSPWLYNASIAMRLTPSLSLYASHMRGLEESGVAPGRLLFTDDKAENIAAAAARGWRTHLFD